MTDHPTPPPRQEGDPDTTGHSWDGIEEFNNPLPKWWLWCFYLTIIWGVAYTIAYPAWPLVSSATSGLLGYSTRAEVAEEIAAVDSARAALIIDLSTVGPDAARSAAKRLSLNRTMDSFSSEESSRIPSPFLSLKFKLSRISLALSGLYG